MIISDLEHLEVVQEENQVEGGLAVGAAVAEAGAIGPNLAVAATSTDTAAVDFFFFSAASAESASLSIAA